MLPPSLFDGKRDEDVIGEEQRVEETDVRMSAVHTSHIFKAYNKQHLAVNDVSNIFIQYKKGLFWCCFWGSICSSWS